MDAPCKVQGNIHVLLCLIHKINVSRILGTYQLCPFIFSKLFFVVLFSVIFAIILAVIMTVISFSIHLYFV